MCIVFVVEDDPSVRTLAERILKRAGHAVLSASSVGEALSVIESDRCFDLLFTDMNLGEHTRGGMHLARTLAASRPGLPVLGTSGDAITNDTEEVFAAPNAFLPKPYSTTQLLYAVANVTRSAGSPSNKFF